ncbi:unnamed protein product [Linum trigynum]|uniref:RWP-RK domain-containing protein n=1 Tax=Linum trigynum TaxID=586398 RepID=A0AAV2E644_9ROSI
MFPPEIGCVDEYNSSYVDDHYAYQCDHYGHMSDIINVASSSSSSSASSSSYQYFSFTTTATATDHGCNKGDDDDEAGFWNELGPLLPEPSIQPRSNNTSTHHSPAVLVPTGDKAATPTNGANALTRESVSKYFYMPITQAARELNVGLTLLKKRCRELGLKRWPHRKLMSLQTLISNVRHLQGDDHDSSRSARLKEAIRVLENEQKLLQECPDLQLQRKTKRLRQACFKANYKNKKKRTQHYFDATSTTASPPANSSTRHHTAPPATATTTTTTFAAQAQEGDDEQGDEEIKSLLLPVLHHDHHYHAPNFGF